MQCRKVLVWVLSMRVRQSADSITRRSLFGAAAVVASVLATRRANAQACPPPAQGQPCICFLAGSSILTPAGEVPVEDLKIGDLLVTHSGKEKPIKWIGFMRHERTTPLWSKGVAPIKLRRGA